MTKRYRESPENFRAPSTAKSFYAAKPPYPTEEMVAECEKIILPDSKDPILDFLREEESAKSPQEEASLLKTAILDPLLSTNRTPQPSSLDSAETPVLSPPPAFPMSEAIKRSDPVQEDLRSVPPAKLSLFEYLSNVILPSFAGMIANVYHRMLGWYVRGAAEKMQQRHSGTDGLIEVQVPLKHDTLRVTCKGNVSLQIQLKIGDVDVLCSVI